jgi:hypothetical protein
MRMGATFGSVFQSWAGLSTTHTVWPLAHWILCGEITCSFMQKSTTSGPGYDSLSRAAHTFRLSVLEEDASPPSAVSAVQRISCGALELQL